MKLEEQVCNLELSKKLYELNFMSSTLFSWIESSEFNGFEIKLTNPISTNNKIYPAYTVAELGKILPREIKHDLNDWSGGYYILFAYSTPIDERESEPSVWYEDNDLHDENMILHGTSGKTEADARAQMLIWLIENGKILIEE